MQDRPTATELAMIAAHLWPSVRESEDGTTERISRIAVEWAYDLWEQAAEYLKPGNTT